MSEHASLTQDQEIIGLHRQYLNLLKNESNGHYPNPTLEEFISSIAQSNLGGYSVRDSAVSVLQAWIWSVENKPGQYVYVEMGDRASTN